MGRVQWVGLSSEMEPSSAPRRRSGHSCCSHETLAQWLGDGLSLRLEVRGWSMWPSIWPGDRVLLEPMTSRGLLRGELGLVLHTDRLRLHRLRDGPRWRKGLGEALLFQGDALAQPDPWVAVSDVIARCTAIEPGPRAWKRAGPGLRLWLGFTGTSGALRP